MGGVTTEKAEGAQAAGKLQAKGKEISNYDKLFEMKLRYFENAVTFVQRYKITGKTYRIKGYLEYGACNDQNCLPPTQVEFDFKGNGPANAPEAKETKTPAQLAKEKADSHPRYERYGKSRCRGSCCRCGKRRGSRWPLDTRCGRIASL